MTTNPNDMKTLTVIVAALAWYAGYQLLGVRQLTERYATLVKKKRIAARV